MLKVLNIADRQIEMHFYDVIGGGYFGGISDQEVAQNLKAAGPLDEIHARINSPGGDVFVGTAIYNLLIHSGAKVITYNDGLAASIASVLMMAGDERHMAENSMMMIHNASTLTMGNQHDHAKAAELLQKASDNIAAIYAKRTGRKPETFGKMMDDETWFTAAEAQEHKLVDCLMPNKRTAANFDPAILSGFCKRIPDLSNVLDLPETSRRYLEACRARRARLHREVCGA